jgi:polyisoprenoid-binding protein YceI
VARHAMVTKVRGSFDEFEGSIHIDGDNPANSSGRVTIQAKSINTRNSQRDEHLRSNDFLDMDNNSEITFVSSGIKQTGDAEFVVSGDLSIRGVSKPIEIPFEYTGSATDPFGNQRLGLEGSVVINRKDYGVSWNAALEGGGVLVSEKVTLEVEVSAIKNS